MAEHSDAGVYRFTGADKNYVCPDDDVQNIDPNAIGRGRAVGMRRKVAMTGFKMVKGQSVDFTGLEPAEDKGLDDEDFALLGHATPPTEVDGSLGDIRQSVFGVDSTTISIAEGLNGSGEFDFDGSSAGEFALSSNHDLQVGEADSIANVRGAAEEAVAHLDLEDLAQEVFLNHAENVRGNRPTPDASVSQAFDRLLNDPDGISSLMEAMDGLLPANTPKKQKIYPGTSHSVERSA
jgi:hypothetical protein